MSLAGKLSDLSLPELLQLVAMSRKTGALEICSEQGGVAWLGLRSGSIVRVALEHGDLERERILKLAGISSDAPSDQVEAALWDAAVQAILHIFEWTEAEFTFEPLDDPSLQWRGPAGIILPAPLSSDFLALEGARLLDESASAAAAAQTAAEAPPLVSDKPTRAPGPSPTTVICVDAELRVLEEIKRGLKGDVTRIHIFQSATDALARFRQYLSFGETPALIVGSMIEDPFEKHRELGWRRFAERVLRIAPRIRVVVISSSGESVAAPGIAVVRRPDARNATEREYQGFVAEVERAIAAGA